MIDPRVISPYRGCTDSVSIRLFHEWASSLYMIDPRVISGVY